MGIGPAAFTAGQTMATFKSIRFALMVGVGGRVPSPESDVCLGDVVIGQPQKQHGGVLLYDMGQTRKGGSVARAGSLNAPPKVLLSAITSMRAHHYQERTTLRQHLLTFNQHPYFSRDKAGPDILFEAAYDHTGGATCEQCSKDRVKRGLARKPHEEVPVHYGKIASGNQVMKDAVTRDRLSAELGGVLCFEMEAADLMNDFQCLVIRGICDYADSHKNKTWQRYAAAVAAACAKEILSLIPAIEVMETQTVEDLHKYYVPFNLKSPPLGKYSDRPADREALERVLLQQTDKIGRRTLVLHGLGDIRKTQLAVNFARRHQQSFSSVL